MECEDDTEHISPLMMIAETVSETSDTNSTLMWLIAWEDVIANSSLHFHFHTFQNFMFDAPPSTNTRDNFLSQIPEISHAFPSLWASVQPSLCFSLSNLCFMLQCHEKELFSHVLETQSSLSISLNINLHVLHTFNMNYVMLWLNLQSKFCI
jgi:hypothetical protein